MRQLPDWNKVESEIAAGYISRRKHPVHDLFIYNYTPRTQYERRWNSATKQCRGLITDAAYNVVSRPLPKFFNYGEVETPPGPFSVYEKMDGMLGVSYWVNGQMNVATRGSFESEGAAIAQSLLSKYSHVPFDPSLTYLFEIIHPKTRIVVDYKGREELVFLAAVETSTGKEVDITLDMPTPRRLYYSQIDEVLSHKEENFEGFVLRFSCGNRLKVKLKDYLELHRLLAGMNERHIWERLSSGQHDDLLNKVPDEFYEWITATEKSLRRQFDEILASAKSDLERAVSSSDGTRKSIASFVKSCQFPGITFLLLDRRDPTEAIWKLVRP